MVTLADFRIEMKKQGDPKRAEAVARYFKTGKGEYGEGDVFLGLTVPQARKIAVEFKELSLGDIEEILHSKIHEERLIALLILVQRFKKGDKKTRKDIYNLYLKSTTYINNWDLIDLSAGHIVGGYLLETQDFSILEKLAHSESIWERRIAIMATFIFIYKGEYKETFKIADILLLDKHDLIQKAVGWMIREVGKRCSQDVEEEFLKTRYQKMPRTMLRYAIERFPETLRKQYLQGKI